MTNMKKINFFIEAIDDFLDCDQDDRTLKHLLARNSRWWTMGHVC